MLRRIRGSSSSSRGGFGFAQELCLRESIDTMRPFLKLQRLGGQCIQFQPRRFDTVRQLRFTGALLHQCHVVGPKLSFPSGNFPMLHDIGTGQPSGFFEKSD